MNMLSGKVAPSSGSILYNDSLISPSRRWKNLGYVRQEDILMASQTPRELLTFSAMLRLPKTMSNDEKLTKVNETIQLLSLTKCQNTLVGGISQRGISGGEAKRVSIGLELITSKASGSSNSD